MFGAHGSNVGIRQIVDTRIDQAIVLALHGLQAEACLATYPNTQQSIRQGVEVDDLRACPDFCCHGFACVRLAI
ncbi:MAG: hypothetical protein BWZ07_03088 [Alphaproteobacteria bacterium ADurb.BinA280]|nr:MAG: hypothetical protein BWZ07_03088 [Alphaproteobacteria bacterium ADurb.BinA280]